MSKYKIANLVDKIFITCTVFLIIYAWINFYLRDLWITFIFSLIFTFAVLFVFWFFLNKKQSRVMLSKKQEEEINNCFLAFRINSKEQKLELIKNCLSKSFNTSIINNNIYYEHNNKKVVVVFAEHFIQLDNNSLIEIVSNFYNTDINEIQIICNEISPNINSQILKNKTITFINKKDLYLNFFLKYNLFPDKENINFTSQKVNFKKLFKNAFTPNKAKRYFFCGLILIFSSIILPYHFYYLIVGSMLLMFALICKLLPKFKN